MMMMIIDGMERIMGYFFIRFRKTRISNITTTVTLTTTIAMMMMMMMMTIAVKAWS
jgi:hypothetical protein